MATAISIFFEAWQIADDEARLSKIASAVNDDVEYDDPRTQNTIKGTQQLSDYVGMFCKNAPGWTAEVKKQDTIGSMNRVTILFSGPGSDGSNQQQLGQYFIKCKGNSISRMHGFVGTGEPT